MSKHESTTPLRPERLAGIRGRVEDATPGPWEWWGEADLRAVSVPDPESSEWPDSCMPVTNEDGQIESSNDAELIAHAPQDLADLLDEVERLRARLTVDDDMAERAARALFLSDSLRNTESKWDRLPEYVRDSWRDDARTILDAALGTQEGA
ncbi:hypothetical protein [Kocuria sp.]|uniref:hypothetical protein n=1 Tax=Kocuria sp. TaxID=1871328 RepID=UPI0026DD02D7|nr:hypothetical protein [Kocuria sp.]MDO4920077.1 hypothetical protein [Kocuria sp.]